MFKIEEKMNRREMTSFFRRLVGSDKLKRYSLDFHKPLIVLDGLEPILLQLEDGKVKASSGKNIDRDKYNEFTDYMIELNPNYNSVIEDYSGSVIKRIVDQEDLIIYADFKAKYNISDDYYDFIQRSSGDIDKISKRNLEIDKDILIDLSIDAIYIFKKGKYYQLTSNGFIKHGSAKFDRLLDRNLYYKSYFDMDSKDQVILNELVVNNLNAFGGFIDDLKEAVESKRNVFNWTVVFTLIEKRVKLNSDDLSSVNALNFNMYSQEDLDSNGKDPFSYLIFFKGEGYLYEKYKHKCICGKEEIKPIKSSLVAGENKDIVKNIIESGVICSSCNRQIDEDTSYERTDGYKEGLHIKLGLSTIYKNKAGVVFYKDVIFPVGESGNNSIAAFDFDDRFKDVIANKYVRLSYHIEGEDIIVKQKPFQLAILNTKNKRSEYYIAKKIYNYYSNKAKNNEDGYLNIVYRYTASSLKNRYYTGVSYTLPYNPKEYIEKFNKRGLNDYGAYDLYAESMGYEVDSYNYLNGMSVYEGNYINIISCVPALESFLKVEKYRPIAYSIFNRGYSINKLNRMFNGDASKPNKVLKLNNSKINLLDRVLGDKYYLKYVNVLNEISDLVDNDIDYETYMYFIKMCDLDYTLSYYLDGDVVSLVYRNTVNSLKDIISLLDSLDLSFKFDKYKFLRYIIRLHKDEFIKDIQYSNDVVRTYLMYLNNILTYLPVDAISEDDIFVNDLLKNKSISDRNVRILSDKIDKENTKKVSENINKRYGRYSNKDYSIVIPEDPSEIIREGRKLNHCIGSYVDGYISGKNTILFVRDNNDIEKPFYTLEIKEVDSLIKIVDLRGHFNKKPNNKVKKFVEDYINQINL